MENKIKIHKGGCLFKLVKLGALVVIILLAVAYFSLGFIADYALGVLTKGTGIDAGVGRVTLNISEQQLGVRDFYITNPPGYPKGNAFAFKEAFIDTDINPLHLIGKQLITVDEIEIVGLDMGVYIKTGTGISAFISTPDSNLTDIAKIFEKEAGLEKKQESAPSETTSDNEKPWKIIIKKLRFADGSATTSINGNSVKVVLPSFVMENLGVKEGGLTPNELAMEILGVLARKATLDVATQVAKDGLKLGGEAVDGTGDVANQGAKATEKAVGSAIKAIGDLF